VSVAARVNLAVSLKPRDRDAYAELRRAEPSRGEREFSCENRVLANFWELSADSAGRSPAEFPEILAANEIRSSARSELV